MIEGVNVVSLYYTFAMIGLLKLVFICFIAILCISWIFGSRKTQDYRKSLSDLYVAAKIRFLAKQDNLSIEDEYKNYKKWTKKKKLEENNYDLDDTIEEGLKEKLNQPVKEQDK